MTSVLSFVVERLTVRFSWFFPLRISNIAYLLFSLHCLSWWWTGKPGVLQSTGSQRVRHNWVTDPMDPNTPGFPVLHHLLEFAQTHVYWVSDAIQPSHPLLSPSPAFSLSQQQGLFQWVGFASGGQRIGASASASVLPMNIQDWFLLEWTCLVSLHSFYWEVWSEFFVCFSVYEELCFFCFLLNFLHIYQYLYFRIFVGILWSFFCVLKSQITFGKLFATSSNVCFCLDVSLS